MIKAIIFDCFGVLVEDSLQNFYATYLDGQPETIKQIKHYDNLSTEGKLSYRELLGHIARLSDVGVNKVEEVLEQNPPNLPLFDYISTELKGRYKLGFLSNAADDWLDELFTQEQLELFDDFVLSYQHNVRKPNTAIYKLAASRLDVEPEECVLIDDVEAYCTGAREIDMNAIHFKSVDQIRTELSTILAE